MTPRTAAAILAALALGFAAGHATAAPRPGPTLPSSPAASVRPEAPQPLDVA